MNEKERIERIMKSMNLSARQFAEQIHVRPGTISNMMSGRNNPSLDVMKRIMERYTSLNPEWLILGEGEMWRTPPGKEAGLFDGLPPEGITSVRISTKEEQPVAVPPRQITKIVVYYSDNTFQEFKSTQD